MIKTLCLSLLLLAVFNYTPPMCSAFTELNANSCSNCKMHDEIREMSIAAIKEQILSKLGLKQAPNMTGRARPRIPPISQLMDMYGMQSDQPVEPGITYHEEIDEFAAKTESVFALAHPHQRLRHVRDAQDVLYFKFSDKVLQHRVAKAVLSLWIWETPSESNSTAREAMAQHEGVLEAEEKASMVPNEEHNQRNHYYHSHHHHHHHQHHHTGQHQRDLITITLQRVLKGTNKNGESLLGPALAMKHVKPLGKSGAWVTIELGRMVSEWFKHPRDNLGVAIKIQNDNAQDSTIWRFETNPNAEFSPFIEVQIQEPESRRGGRTKRELGINCAANSTETRCCRFKLTIDFEKFGWDWVIAPKKYDANYCSGSCPIAFLPAYPNTHIVSLADRPKHSGPCCGPRKLSEITMLYFDNEYQIVFSRLPGMVVERCGCA